MPFISSHSWGKFTLAINNFDNSESHIVATSILTAHIFVDKLARADNAPERLIKHCAFKNSFPHFTETFERAYSTISPDDKESYDKLTDIHRILLPMI